MSERDFQAAVLNTLTELKVEQTETKTEVKAIVARLDKLNGSVASHTEQIGRLQIQQACCMAEKETSQKWISRLWPFLWAGLGLFAGLVLQHASDFLKLMK